MHFIWRISVDHNHRFFVIVVKIVKIVWTFCVAFDPMNAEILATIRIRFIRDWMCDALLASWWRIKLVKWHYRTFDGLCWFIMQRNCSKWQSHQMLVVRLLFYNSIKSYTTCTIMNQNTFYFLTYQIIHPGFFMLDFLTHPIFVFLQQLKIQRRKIIKQKIKQKIKTRE